MAASTNPLLRSEDTSAVEVLHRRFLSILPAIERHGRVYFRHLKCWHRLQEALAEMAALAWKWFLRFIRKGKDAADFPTVLAVYAARAVRSGRRLCGHEKRKDVLSPTAQQRRGFSVSTLPDGSSLDGNVFDEALTDNMRTPVYEQAAFRIDFPAWVKTRSDRDRRIINDLLGGERTMDAARRHGLSAGRIAQLRRCFKEDWERHCGDRVEHVHAVAARVS